MFIIITTVQLKPGTVDAVLALFEATNPDLVQGQSDWIKASFCANREQNQVTVLAYWRSAESYQQFSNSLRFRSVMTQFTPYFTAPPRVAIQEILFEM